MEDWASRGDGNGAVSNLARRVTAAKQTGGTRKLTIKPFKQRPKLPPDFEEDSWRVLSNAVDAVHQKRPVTDSFETLYRRVEDVCLHKLGAGLYARLRASCESHVKARVATLSNGGATEDPVAFLNRVDEVWNDHCDATLTIRSLFLYLDRTHVAHQASGEGLSGSNTSAAGSRPGGSTESVRSLWDMGLALFRASLLSDDSSSTAIPGATTTHNDVLGKATRGLLALVEKERNGEAVDRGKVKRLTRMFQSLGVYSDRFERLFVEATRSFYRAEGTRFASTGECGEYLEHCERRLDEEQRRCDEYLEAGTRRGLIQCVEKELVDRHAGRIVEKGLDAMVDRVDVHNLKRMHSLLRRVDGGLDRLRAAFGSAVRARGVAVVKDEENDKDMVRKLLELKKKADDVATESFGGDEQFASVVKESFESFVNQRANRPAELIAKHIDGKLRGAGKGETEDELEHVLDRAMALFRHIQGKDVFEAFYKKDLAKRLLLGKSASVDAEKSMISRLKAECGSQFTTKLEGMFKDVDISRDVMRSFRADVDKFQKIEAAGVELYVNVLTAGYWPTYPTQEVSLPPEMDIMQGAFRDHYLGKHGGRRLVWQNSLGHCVLRAEFPKCGTKELAVSLFQAVVCLLFNGQSDSLTFEEIRAATGIEDKELRRTLQSLACGKVRVLVKEPKGRDVEDGDVFAVNEQFNERLYRIKVNSIQLKETKEENAATNERVFQDRQYQIDAAIVRIMKTRKTLSHQLLIAELLAQVKFPAKPTDLKKRIESLIDREYLERDRANAQVYNYLA
jgi:cullin 4